MQFYIFNKLLPVFTAEIVAAMAQVITDITGKACLTDLWQTVFGF